MLQVAGIVLTMFACIHVMFWFWHTILILFVFYHFYITYENVWIIWSRNSRWCGCPGVKLTNFWVLVAGKRANFKTWREIKTLPKVWKLFWSKLAITYCIYYYILMQMCCSLTCLARENFWVWCLVNNTCKYTSQSAWIKPIAAWIQADCGTHNWLVSSRLLSTCSMIFSFNIVIQYWLLGVMNHSSGLFVT